MAHRIPLPKTLNLASIEALHEALTRAAADERQDVWVLQGGGDGVFCRGMDLSMMVDGADGARGARAFAFCLNLIASAPRPVVAVVDGVAQGGGVGLAAAADLVIATSSSTFALPEGLFGLLPAIILPVLHERLSPQRARTLALRGGGVSATWAAESGLIDEVVDDAGTLEQVLAKRVRELSRVATRAVVGIREWSDAARQLPCARATERGAELTGALVEDLEIRAAIRRFVDDGEPPWLARGAR